MFQSWSKLAAAPPLLRILVFLLSLGLLWAPVALPLYWLSHQGRLPGGDVVPMALLYGVFLLLLPQWQRRVHGASQPWLPLGIWITLAAVAIGVRSLLLGLGGLAALVLIQVICGWAGLNPIRPELIGIIGAGLLTALAVAAAEELLFRGWLLQELELGLSPGVALICNGSIFALAHFIKPLAAMLAMLPQFFGLLLLGITLVWARRIPVDRSKGITHTSLLSSIGLHSGLVWGYYILDVGQLITPTGVVPAWVTGLQGNPLAGLLGLGLLGGLASLFRTWAGPSANPRHLA